MMIPLVFCGTRFDFHAFWLAVLGLNLLAWFWIVRGLTKLVLWSIA